MTIQHTDDLRIAELKELSTPAQVIGEFALGESAQATVSNARAAVHRILDGSDDRLVVVVGPCSIHDTRAALEYAGRLVGERERHADVLEIVLRVYFEKPRTT
ncbi:MAG: 3-deoxy-7-phosphoheptulonate synthase, partial [Rudaea sp.]